MIRYKMRLTPFPLLELAGVSPCSLLQCLYVEVYRCSPTTWESEGDGFPSIWSLFIKNLMDSICNTASSLFLCLLSVSLELVSPGNPQDQQRSCALEHRDSSDLWFDCLEINFSSVIQEFMSRICDFTFPGWSNKQAAGLWASPIDHPTSLKTLRVLQYYSSRCVWCKISKQPLFTVISICRLEHKDLISGGDFLNLQLR